MKVKILNSTAASGETRSLDATRVIAVAAAAAALWNRRGGIMILLF